MLLFFVFALTDPRNPQRPPETLSALFIGLTITILVCVLAPLTQACFNPVRDFGPRVVAYLAGWGAIAFPGPRGGFALVYGVAPLVGGLLGASFYECLLRPGFIPLAESAVPSLAVETPRPSAIAEGIESTQS